MATPPSSDESDYTVLIVDDSPEDRMAFRRFLLQSISPTYIVEEEEMGEEALARLLSGGDSLPDCLLLDFNLPDMDGVEFLTELTKGDGSSAREPRLPCAVVMLTGSGDEAAAVAAMKAGAQDYLVKGGLSPEALRRSVRNALEMFELAERLHESEERLRLATAAAGVAIWDYDPQTGAVSGDARYRALLGLPADQPLSYDMCLARVHEEDQERVRQAAIAATDPSGTGWYSVEYRTSANDPQPGMAQWVQSNGQVFFDPSRTFVERFVGTALDITGRKRAEEERAQYAAKQERIAETLQRSLLIFPPPGTFPDLDVYIEYAAALDEAMLGGDFADVFALDGGRIALVVGDVTGKGLSAATYTAEIKFALRAFLRESHDPSLAMSRLNRYLIDGQRLDLNPREELVSLAIVVVDTSTREVLCSCAGSEPPLIVRRSTDDPIRIVETPEASGPILAMTLDAVYRSVALPWERGDMLVLTTDGITEARIGRRGELFGYERFARAAEDAANQPSLADIAQTIIQCAQEFAGGRQSDDICLLVAR